MQDTAEKIRKLSEKADPQVSPSSEGRFHETSRAGCMNGERERQQAADLYATAREGVVRYLVASGLSPETASESAQEAFLRFYSALRKGEQIREPRSWVFKVARNIALNSARKNAAQSAFSEALVETIASIESSAETRLIEKEWMEGFRDAWMRLSDRQRQCLELRAQGLRFREIADVLDVQISTAAEYVRRGIEELRRWNRCRS